MKITKEARTLINGYAAELKPEAKFRGGKPVYKMQPIDGSVLLQAGELDANGRPGIPGVTYRGHVLVYEDHRLNMERAYSLSGIKGIEEYVESVQRKQLDREAFVDTTLSEVPQPKKSRVGLLIEKAKDLVLLAKLKLTK